MISFKWLYSRGFKSLSKQFWFVLKLFCVGNALFLGLTNELEKIIPNKNEYIKIESDNIHKRGESWTLKSSDKINNNINNNIKNKNKNKHKINTKNINNKNLNYNHGKAKLIFTAWSEVFPLDLIW